VKIHIVLPAYNEEDNISALYQENKEIMDKHAYEHEMIFVQDGSSALKKC
jgi:glycosyltransferase involved in cell wall biosynthesis